MNKTYLTGFILGAVLLLGGIAAKNYVVVEQTWIPMNKYLICLAIAALIMILSFIKLYMSKNEKQVIELPVPAQPKQEIQQESAQETRSYNDRLAELQLQEEQYNQRLKALGSAPMPRFAEFPEFEKKKEKEDDGTDWIERMMSVVKKVEENRKVTAKQKQAEYDAIKNNVAAFEKEKEKVVEIGRQLKIQFLKLDNEIIMKQKQLEMMEHAGVVPGGQK